MQPKWFVYCSKVTRRNLIRDVDVGNYSLHIAYLADTCVSPSAFSAETGDGTY